MCVCPVNVRKLALCGFLNGMQAVLRPDASSSCAMLFRLSAGGIEQGIVGIGQGIVLLLGAFGPASTMQSWCICVQTS